MEHTVQPIPQKPGISSALSCSCSSLDELVNNCFLAHLGFLSDPTKIELVNKFVNHLMRSHCHENLQFLIDIYVYDLVYRKVRERLNNDEISEKDTITSTDILIENTQALSLQHSSSKTEDMSEKAFRLKEMERGLSAKEFLEERPQISVSLTSSKSNLTNLYSDSYDKLTSSTTLNNFYSDANDDKMNAINASLQEVIDQQNKSKKLSRCCRKNESWQCNTEDSNHEFQYDNTYNSYTSDNYKSTESENYNKPSDLEIFNFSDNNFSLNSIYDISDAKILENQWNSILNNYIRHDSPNQINLSQAQHTALLLENKNDRIHNPKVLLKVKNEILQLLQENAYRSFIKDEKSSCCSSSVHSPIRSPSPLDTPLTSPSPVQRLQSPLSSMREKSSPILFDSKSKKKHFETASKTSSTQISPITSATNPDLDSKLGISSLKHKLHRQFYHSSNQSSQPTSSSSSSVYLSSLFGHLKGSPSTTPAPDDKQDACKHSTSPNVKFWSKWK